VRRLNRGVVIAVAATVAIVILVAVAASLLMSSHRAPPALALSTVAPSGSIAALAGRWSVGPGSVVGYRAKEKFINQPAETEAVARTSQVSGSVVVSIAGGSVTISQMKFTVELASLTSQDKYANYQVYQRDFFVRSIYLQTDSFPTATFMADAASFPMPAGGPVTVDVGGNLSVHGATNRVVAHVQAQESGGQAEAAGTISVDMRDFGIDPPDISFTKAEPQITIEYDLKLVHS
jgi:polyisoprenoid-binding protein YceI